MSFTDIFIRRPVLSSVVSLLILLIGSRAAFNLQVRQYPELSNTTITITTVYPGANADVIKGFITVPIQQAVASAEGIDTLSSTSRQNIEHGDAQPPPQCRPRPRRHRRAVEGQSGAQRAAAGSHGSRRRQADRRVDGAHVPVVQQQRADLLADHRLPDARRAAQAADRRRRRQRADPRRPDVRHAHLARPGEDGRARRDAAAGPRGAGDQQLHHRRRPDQRRLRPDDDQRRDLARQRRSLRPAGRRRRAATRWCASATSPRSSSAPRTSIRPRPSTASRRCSSASIRPRRPIRSPSSPTCARSSRRIEAELPPGMSAAIAYDSTKFIDASISEVQKTLIEAALIVIVVIFLFLGSLRSTLIPIVTIPLSLIGVMFALLALGYSHQPADAAGPGAGHRPRRRRRHRRRREHPPPYRGGLCRRSTPPSSARARSPCRSSR